MITSAELHRTAEDEGLRFDQVEKDYVLLWLLRGLSLQNLPAKGWVFKGGTCLRHCYYTGYRFSEDLDFSSNPDLGGLETAQEILNNTASRMQESSGIRIRTKEPRTIPGDFQVEFPLEYSRGGMRSRGLPTVKIHLTFDEPLLTKAVTSVVTPRYSDLGEFTIASYSKTEIVAEKMRALLQQQQKWPRPRDLYDLWFMVCHSKEKFEAGQLEELFTKKCEVRENQMKPLMKSVPDFEEVWREWVDYCQILFKASN